MFSQKTIVITIGNYGAVVALHNGSSIENKIFLDELNDFEAGQQDIVVDSFIAGCEYILNKK